MSALDLSVSLTNWQRVEAMIASGVHGGETVRELITVMTQSLNDPESPLCGRIGDDQARFAEGLLCAADMLGAVGATLQRMPGAGNLLSGNVALHLAGALGVTGLRLWREAP